MEDISSILIADDNSENLKVLSGMLKQEGYIVRVAMDGKQALDSVRTQAPSLILMDIQMPKMNGYEACKRIKLEEGLKNLPVVFISAMTETFNKVKAFESGGIDYIQKPFQVEEVLARVRTHLEIADLRRQLETKNVELFAQFRSTFEQSAVGMAQVDSKTGKYIKVNERLAEMLGYSESELLSKSISDITDPSFHDSDSTDIERLRKGEIVSFTKEKPYIHKDGSQVWCRVTSSKVVYPDSQLTNHLIAIVEDISMRKTIEGENVLYEERFQSIKEHSDEGFWLLGLPEPVSVYLPAGEQLKHIYESRILECSDAMARSLEYKNSGALIGKSLSDIQINQQNKSFHGMMLEWIESGYNLSGIVTSEPDQENNLIWFSHNIIGIIKDEKLERIWSSQKDISREKNVEIALLESEERLHLATAAAKIGVFDWKIGSDRLIWDDNMFGIFGIDKKNFKGSYADWAASVHPDDLEISEEAIQDALKEKRPFNITFRTVRPDGAVRFIKGIGTVHFDQNKDPQRMVGVNWDITEQKQAETDLIYAKEQAEEADQLKTAFLASISHEIRTPLNSIVGFSDFIANEINNPRLQKFAGIIKTQNQLLLQLVTDIIEFSKIESGVFRVEESTFDLNEIIEDLAIIFSLKCPESIELIKDIPEGSMKIISDENSIKQIFNNLISNALKFTTEGEISFGYSLQKNGFVKGFVKDTGIGIPGEKLNDIFDRFTKLDEFSQGAGLGLSIVRSILRALDGEIWVESESGSGSAFYFTFPSKPGLVEEKAISIEKPSGRDIAGQNVLIAEDDLSNYMYIEEILKKKGVITTHAINGQEALDHCKSNDYDVVLMDLKMPVLNGFESARKIKEIKPKQKIIAVSAHALPAEKKQAIDSGCDGFVTKPIDLDDLFEVMRKND